MFFSEKKKGQALIIQVHIHREDACNFLIALGDSGLSAMFSD